MVPGAAWGVAIPGKAPFLLVLAVGVWDISVAWESNKVTHGKRVETGAGATTCSATGGFHKAMGPTWIKSVFVLASVSVAGLRECEGELMFLNSHLFVVNSHRGYFPLGL